MLGKLINTLKSQRNSQSIKSSPKNTQNDQKTQQSIQTNQNIYEQIQNYKIDLSLSSKESCVLQNSIPKIRYFILPNCPKIFNLTLSCPISIFHTLPHSLRKVKQINLAEQSFPHYLTFLKPLLQKQIPIYNHILVNVYPPGIGIMPHTDGPAYFPKVFVLSLNSYAIINFQKEYRSGSNRQQNEQNIKNYSGRVLLEPNSVHIFQQNAYVEYLHGIQNFKVDSFLVRYDNQIKKVANANISNYQQLQLKQFLQKIFDKNVEQYEQANVRILKLNENHQNYTHKIQIDRKQRISITIREIL